MDYKIISLASNLMKVVGTMRLSGPNAYNEPFKEAFEGIENNDYTLDVSELEFLNSSIHKFKYLV